MGICLSNQIKAESSFRTVTVMAAYSAVVSFEKILEQNSDYFGKEEVDSLEVKVSSLQESIDRIFPAKKDDRDTANNLGARIRDAVYTAQDSIESFVFGKIHLGSEASLSLAEIEANMDPIVVEAAMLALSIGKDKKDLPHEPPSFKASEAGTKIKIVGQEKDKERVTAELLSDVSKREVIPITGMPGIGKTTLARSIFDDPNIRDKFPYRAWVTVSQDYNVAELLAKLLVSMESKGRKGGETEVEVGSAASMREKLHQTLYNNQYLVVIDDLWDERNWMEILNSLPDNDNRSRILLTTRIQNVAKSVKSSSFLHEMQPLDDENSWVLLGLRTFGEKPCPPELVDTGKEIAKNCKGLPLSLIVIGGLLSQERKTDEYWRSIQEDIYAATRDSKVEEAYKDILSLSYEHLPPKLKGCFLYMGAFREDSEILVTRLIRLWVAEGFLNPPEAPPPPLPPSKTLEDVAKLSVTQLIDRNLVMIRKNSTHGRIKTCGLHDSLRELSEQESDKDKFFHYRKRYKQNKEEGTDNQRRISVQKNILMCLEEVYDATKTITQARSLLFVGPHHHHPLPFILTFDLLRVVDAFTIYFIAFPYEFLKLVHLRYLALTYNGKLPSDLCKLDKLQALVVKRQPKIIFVGSSYLPDEIWKMPQLRHLIFTESDIPLPPDTLLSVGEDNPPFFVNLQSLANVNATNLTEKVLGHMPNLKKLGMWLESPCDLGLYLKQVPKLENFTFMVLNPIPRKSVNLLGDGLFFPDTVMKLDLSGCGLPWEDMDVIQKLPNLEVLKLRELAFNGDEWVPTKVFEKLKFLMIEYLNLKWLDTDGSHFPCLQRLILRHCYELEGIPAEIGGLGYMELIELVDCSPDAVKFAEAIEAQQKELNNKLLQVRIYSSWQ